MSKPSVSMVIRIGLTGFCIVAFLSIFPSAPDSLLLARGSIQQPAAQETDVQESDVQETGAQETDSQAPQRFRDPNESPEAVAAAKPDVAEWNQWRGPGRDGLLPGAEWPDSLDEQTLVRKWSVPLGPSYSGPIVVGDRVFTTETVNQQTEVIRALDRETGEEIWNVSWEGSIRVPMFAASNGSWIRATPCYDDGRLYVNGIRDVLVCLNADTGEEIWRVDFPNQTGAAVPSFGCVCSPLISGDDLYVQAGGSFCKLNKLTGEIVWKSLDDGGGMNGSAFSSPVLAEVAGQLQLVVQTREDLCGVDPESGSKLWSFSVPTFRGMNILTPVVFNGDVFTSTYGGTTRMVRVDKDGNRFSTDDLWQVAKQGYMSSPVIVDSHAYLTMRNRTIGCFDLEEGEEKWFSPRFSQYSSLVSNGEKIIALDSEGKLILFRANPEKFDLIAERQIGDNTWAHLGVRGNQLFIRELNAMTVYDWASK